MSRYHCTKTTPTLTLTSEVDEIILHLPFGFRQNALTTDSIFRISHTHTHTHRVEFGYNNSSLCDTLFIMSNSLWYQLIPHRARVFSALLSTTYPTASTSDITAVLAFCSNIIFQLVGYFENSSTSSSVRGQALHDSRPGK